MPSSLKTMIRFIFTKIAVLNGHMFIVTLLLLSSCKSEIDIDLYLKNKLKNTSNSGTSNSTLLFPVSQVTILSGESVNISTTNGLPPYVGNTFSNGAFDNGTTTFTAADSLGAINFNLAITDTNGLSGNLPVKIIGLKEKFLLDQPLAYGDQNYPMTIAQTVDGAIYTSSVIVDGSGWEGWTTWKSTNNGSTWSMVDRYFMYLAGESHPMEMATKGNDIYICGYVWGSTGTPSTANSEWLVRKSSNGGSSWQNVDHSWFSANDNICTSITISASGDLFTAGYSVNAGYNSIIKTSIDDGQSWQEIGNFPAVGTPHSIRSSPNGDLWVVIENKFYKGTYSLGSWNWSGPISITASVFGYSSYQKKGELTVENDSIAYFTTEVGAFWKIYRTTNGGTTWSELHSRSGGGVSLLSLSTGELISNGNRTVAWNEGYNQIIKSTDGGTTFNFTLNKGAVGNRNEGGYLLELINGDLISVGMRYSDNQIVVHTSNDKGSTWLESSIIYYYDRLYSEVTDYAEDSLGNIFTAGWVDSILPGDMTEPYVIMKSSNNGSSWSQSDYILNSGFDHFSDQIEVNSLNDYIFATDHSYSQGLTNLRMSTNAGASWNTVDTLVESIGNRTLSIDTNGNVYYATGLILRRGSGNGTGFTNAATFPVNGTHTAFSIKKILALNDGSLLMAAMATESSVNYALIYRSTNLGVNWTEIRRAPANSWEYFSLTQAPNGNLYALIGSKIYKSSSIGSSWVEIYNTTMGLGSPGSIITSNDSTFFFSNGDNVHYYNTTSSSWKTFWKINTAITPAIDSYITHLFKCKFSSIGVCANVVDYTKGKGSANYLWAAE